MKWKLWITVFLALALSFMAFAQTAPYSPPPTLTLAQAPPILVTDPAAPVVAAPKLPAFEVYLGMGQVATSETGNAISYSANFQTNLTAGFRWFPVGKFALEVQYVHDTVSIARWLEVHQFLPFKEVTAYNYSCLEPEAEYWVIRNGSGGLYGFIGLPYYFGVNGASGALGYAIGAGGQFAFWKGFFVETKAQFIHVQQYIVPVANVGEASVSFGYRF